MKNLTLEKENLQKIADIRLQITKILKETSHNNRYTMILENVNFQLKTILNSNYGNSLK